MTTDTELDGAEILHRVLWRLNYYSPSANACSGEWADEFRDYEMAFEFLWAHFYAHFGRRSRLGPG